IGSISTRRYREDGTVGPGFRRDSADWRDMTELLFRNDGYLRSCTARVIAADERGIRLDRTVFYPTGGGQPGDTGVLRLYSGQAITIADTVKGGGPDEVMHIPAPGSPIPEHG